MSLKIKLLKVCAEEGTVVTPLKVLFLDSEKSHLLNLKSILGVECVS